MRMPLLLVAASPAVSVIALATAAPPPQCPALITGSAAPLGGGGPITDPHAGRPDPSTGIVHNCITPEIRADIERRIAAYQQSHPPIINPYESRAAPPYAFIPQGGTLFQDVDTATFVDLNPAAGSAAILDYMCGNLTYDGHAGVDLALRSFAEQIIGVPIFAALPGTVVDRADGAFDQNITFNGQPGNYVILDHGAGRQTWYFHMRNGSVAPQLGEFVKAGQQIGLTASSGNSAGPHLHFGSVQNSVVYEPFAGACRPGASGWANQLTYRTGLYISDCAWSATNMTTVPGWPYESPHTGQLANTEDHWFWFSLHNLPPNSTYALRYVRPSGALEFQAPTYPFNNSTLYSRAWFWFWGYYIPAMRDGSANGVWRMQMDINGVQVVDAPVTVRAARDPNFNRPPAPLQGIAFEPAAPVSNDVIFCRISNSLLYDDPDYDIVRYDYLWTVNGQTVRHIVSAGFADAIAADTAPRGALLRCVVTPSDGRLNAAASSIQVRIPGCPADFDDGSGTGTPDGGIGIEDLLYYLGLYDAGLPAADIDDGNARGVRDGGVGIEDLLYYLSRYDAGC